MSPVHITAPSSCRLLLVIAALDTSTILGAALSLHPSNGMSRGLVLNGAPLAAHAFTALPIAAARAVAHERSGAAVEDPLARKLLLGAGGAKGKEVRARMPIRSRKARGYLRGPRLIPSKPVRISNGHSCCTREPTSSI